MSLSLLSLRRSCERCGSNAPIWDPVCLDCGHHILPMWWLRITGPILILLGTGVAGTLGWLTLWMAKVMLRGNDPAASARWTGNAWQAIAALSITTAVSTLGVMFIGIGVGQLMRATRSAWVIRFVALGYFVVFLGYVLVQWSA